MKSTVVAGLAIVAVVVSGCADGEPSPPAEEVPHGYVEGAEEAAEAQSRLVLADAGSGDVRVLDLISGDVTAVGKAPGVEQITGDGRFAYLASSSKVRIVDSGAWMVDHGDHVHYYRAETRDVGTIGGAEPVRAHSDSAVVAVSQGSGTTRLLDRAKLDEGTIAETGEIQNTARGAAVVPYEGHLVAPITAPGRVDTVEVRNREGKQVASIAEDCPEVSGTAVTRRGVVFGCADGALLVSAEDGRFSGEKIPYPRPVAAAERAREFHHRPGSDTLAAKAGETGVWSLDVAHRNWLFVASGQVVATNAVGAGGPLLTLTRDGVLHAYDAETGQQTAEVQLMNKPQDPSDAPTIEIDTSRAYVNDVAAGVIHEIDYNDNLRSARTFELGGQITHMVETGR